MKLNLYLLNVGIFFVPAVLLTILATITITRSYHLREAVYAGLCLYAFAIANFFEGTRHILDVQYSSFIHLTLVLPFLMLGLAFAVHLEYAFASTFTKVYKKRTTLLFYAVVVVYSLASYVAMQLEPMTYTQRYGLYYDTHFALDIVIYSAFSAFVLFILYFIYKSQLDAQLKYKRFIVVLAFVLIGTIVAFAFAAIRFRDVLPPEPLVTLVAPVAGGLIGVAILFMNFTPSIASRYKLLVGLSPHAVLLVSTDLEVLELNENAQQLLRVRANERLDHLFTHRENARQLEQFFFILQRDRQVKHYTFAYHLVDGQVSYYALEGAMFDINHQQQLYAIIRDITHEHEQKKYMEYLAFHDSLTALPNRTYFLKHMEVQLEQHVSGILVLSDLNFFKQINDTHGHAIGDEVLKHTARTLRSVLPPPVECARLGGDEFMLFFPEMSEIDFLVLLHDLRHAFKHQLYRNGAIELEVIPSFGYTFVDSAEGKTFERLYQEADEAMYADKKRIKAMYSSSK